MTSHEQITGLLADPTVSFWLKDAIRDLLARDALDAAYDTAILADVFKLRCTEYLGKCREIGSAKP